MKKSPTRFIRRVDNKFTSASLDLNFQNMTPSSFDSRITFTRASNATYFDGSGILQTASTNVPRLDHSPTTRLPLGLLIEEQRTNLLTYSEDFANAAWSKTNSSITANTIVAPDGTLTGDKTVENTASNVFHTTSQYLLVSGASGVSYTLSIYAKQAGRSKFVLQIDSGNFGTGNCIFNLANGTAAPAGGTGSSPKITDVGNGWYRCSLVVTSSGAFTSVGLKVILVNASDAQQYTGDGTSGIYIWGAQLEAGAFPTSYIPTTTAAATRNADVATMTGTNFSSWYNQSEGSLFVEYNRPLAVTGLRSVAAVSDGGFNNRITFRTDSSILLTPFVVTSGVVQAALPQTVNSNANNKVALVYKNNDFASCANGSTVGTDTSGTVPVVDRLSIGSVLTAEVSCSYIRRIAYWGVRLDNSKLQALTT